uniref:Uncharacterized protein n=1 Tax=Panagrolaimus superbus TaxID=310955 RepID=A0A914YBW8_9BILA
MNEGKQSRQRGFEADHVNDFIGAMTTGGRAQMLADHNTLRKKERHVFYFMRNPSKNRYSNVVLFNEGAIILEKQNKDEGTYIHATKLQSKFGRFVLAQAPKSDTLFDWYRMIWQCNIRVIVCLVSLENTDECAKYFKQKSGKSMSCKRFSVKTFAVRPENSVTTFELRLKNSSAKGDEKERVIHVVHYPNWNINRSPEPRHLLQLLRATWALEQSMASVCDARETPTLVHGSSGVRRTGAFVIISMLCRQLREKGTVSIIAACSTVRKYRYGVMRNKIMFATMLETILNFAADQGMVDRNSKPFSNAIKKARIALMDRNKEEGGGGGGGEGGDQEDDE